MTNQIEGYTLCQQCGQGWQGDVKLCKCNDIAQKRGVVHFVAPLAPVAKQRPRTKKTRKGYKTWTPQATKNFEDAIADYARMACSTPYDKTVSLRATIHIKQDDNRKRDIDNIIKSILDGMNKVVYHDDYQIIDLHATLQRGADVNEITVTIEAIEA